MAFKATGRDCGVEMYGVAGNCGHEFQVLVTFAALDCSRLIMT